MVHDVKAGWLITKRGWSFLANNPVPSKIWTFRNVIINRSDEKTITISTILKKSMQGILYNEEDWKPYTAEYQQGSLY